MTSPIHKSATLLLTEQLLSRASVTPLDADCQSTIAQRLQAVGFVCQTIESGPKDAKVTNLWAKRQGNLAKNNGGKLLVFAGHTDVVPTGPLSQWHSDPFKPTYADGKLFARGASDMKTSLAAFVVATELFLSDLGESPCHLSIGFLLTSDEEGPSVDGTRVVCEALQERGEQLDYCIVGEPTSVKKTGDMIKNGRRGTLSGKLTVNGIQGHIAYPHLARNPIHIAAPALAALVSTNWDAGNAYFQPTSWQMSNIHAGTGANNVIASNMVVDFNFRFCTESTPESLKERFQATLEAAGLVADTDFNIVWTLGGLPFLTEPAELVQAVQEAIAQETGLQAELSTTGGTSDGRFIAKICKQVVECGPPNASIHQINEHIALVDIEPLTQIYRRILHKLNTVPDTDTDTDTNTNTK